MTKEFKLRMNLFGHSMDIRALSIAENNDIISGSRDKTAKYWKYNALQNTYQEVMTYRSHENFVGSVLYLEQSSQYPDGLVITGGYDKVIHVYKPGEPFPTFTFKGEHTNTVCALTKGHEPNSFLSSSWDNSAKYWNLTTSTSKALVTFSGHQAAVWHVKQLSNGQIATASADKTVGIWSPIGQRLSTLSEHTDVVRHLEDFPEQKYFISASNDASIKVWNYDGQCLKTYYGHGNFIYSVARLKAFGLDSFVSSDENRSVKVWENGENTFTIDLPAQSVWCVACLSNGDIVTGSSDGVIRIFTRDEESFADEATLTKFQEEVNALKKQALQEIGGVKISDLPGKEALYEPGKKAGQMKMIRENNTVMAYTWVEAGDQSHWEKVGEVLGGSDKDEAGKTQFEGQAYDFVFSVDVEDGKPPLKLPYNRGEDPYVAATKFLAKNNLPKEYLEQVVDFILKNSKEQYVPPVNEYQDPFTGGSRYTPGSNAGTRADAGMNLDPFTGGSSYSTALGRNAPQPVSAGANADPFTGGSSYTSLNQTASTSNFFPIASYKSFDIGDPNVVLNKLKEFNQKCGDSNGKIDDHQLEEMVKICIGPPTDPNAYDVLFKLLDWPDDIVFPVIDVVRMAVRHQQNNEIISSMNNGVIMEKLKNYISESCKVINNMVVALRTICNLCLHDAGQNLVYTNRFDILENVTTLSNLNKNCQVALSTALLNLTTLTVRKNDEVGFSILANVLPDILTKLTDPESQFRVYVAVGTLIVSANSQKLEVIGKINTNESFTNLLELHKFSGQNDVENKRMNCVKQLLGLL